MFAVLLSDVFWRLMIATGASSRDYVVGSMWAPAVAAYLIVWLRRPTCVRSA